MNTNRIFASFLITLFLLFNCPLSNTPNDTAVPSQEPRASADPNFIKMDATEYCNILMKNTKGSDLISYEVDTILYCSTGALTAGTYTLQAHGLIGCDNMINSNTGISTIDGEHFKYAAAESVSVWADQEMPATVRGYLSTYLLNTTANSLYSDLTASFSCYWSYYNAGNFINLYNNDLVATLYYELAPTFILNSSHYTFQNTQWYVFDKISQTYQMQDPTDIRLNHPHYKLRIYDTGSNLIYYDDDFVSYTTYRTITIDSLKIQNNSPEPINASIYSSFSTSNTTIPIATDYHFNTDDQSPSRITANSGTLNSTDVAKLESADFDGIGLASVHSNSYYKYRGVSTFQNGSVDDWTQTEPANTAVTYNALVASHTDVIQLWDGASTGGWSDNYRAAIYKNFTSSTNGTIQFWMRLSNANLRQYIVIRNAAKATIMQLLIWQYDIYMTHVAGLVLKKSDVIANNQWYVFTIIFNTDAGSWWAIFNGTSIGTEECVTSGAAMGFYAETRPEDSNYYIYLDSISPLWETNLDFGYTVALNDVTLFEYDSICSTNIDITLPDYSTVQNFTINYRVSTNVTQNITHYLYNRATAAYETLQTTNSTTLTDYSSTKTVYVQDYLNSAGNLTLRFAGLTYMAADYALILDYISVTFTNLTNTVTYTTYTHYYPANYSVMINPYDSVLTNFTLTGTFYQVYRDLYGNMLENSTFVYPTTRYLNYTDPEVREIFISLANQRGDYLDWENFQIEINGTQIYENRFYREIDSSWNISIYTRFDKYITSVIHTVDRDSNYIPITITQHSLKIYNQQELFAHSNITFDPAYYTSTQSWSEWIAPGEIVSYLLSPGSYLVNITESETHTSTVYTYILASDDILLVQSYNTLFNVLYNIENVNQTLGTQITDVYINITNQNSDINESIVNVVIEFTNINSTLGTMLYWQNTTMNAMANNITTFYIYSQSQFSILNNNINTSFALLNSSIYLMNNSIYTSINMLEAGLTLMNNTIMGNLTMFIQLSPELTAIYTNTLFSENLTWSTDSEAVLAQCDDYRFMNEYATQAVELELKYGSEVRTLYIAAQAQINQNIINHDVQYRVKSVKTGEYLTEYEDLDTKNVSVGYYDEVIPATPEEIRLEIKDYLMVALFFCIIALATAGMYILAKSDMNKNPKSQKNPDDAPGVSYTGGFYYGKRDRPPRKASSNSAVVTVIVLAVMSFIVVYLAIMYGF